MRASQIHLDYTILDLALLPLVCACTLQHVGKGIALSNTGKGSILSNALAGCDMNADTTQICIRQQCSCDAVT